MSKLSRYLEFNHPDAPGATDQDKAINVMRELERKLAQVEVARILAMSDEQLLREAAVNGEDVAESARRGRALFEKVAAEVKL